VRFGPYELENRIAVEGTAEVYVARPIDPKAQPQRLVAVLLVAGENGQRRGQDYPRA